MSDAVEVRAGEQIDPAALLTWLCAHTPDVARKDSSIDIKQFPAGFSNLTYLVTLSNTESAHSLVLRRPPRGVTSGTAHNVLREYGILSALYPLGVPVPATVVSCDDATVIGSPFYLMEFTDGVILRGKSPIEIVHAGEHAPALLDALSTTFVSTLVGLHAVDLATTPTLREIGRPDGYVRRQLQGWTARWEKSKTRDVSTVERVALWLDAHQPSESDVALVHNDFKFDNLVLDRHNLTRVAAILDWEMATIGDPLMDLGTSLAYWVEAGDAPIFRALGLGMTALPGCATRKEIVARYAAVSGRDVRNAAFYYAFGLFKVAVVAQQIYARSVQGLTSDPRFAMLGDVVDALGAHALHVTESGEL